MVSVRRVQKRLTQGHTGTGGGAEKLFEGCFALPKHRSKVVRFGCGAQYSWYTSKNDIWYT